MGSRGATAAYAYGYRTEQGSNSAHHLNPVVIGGGWEEEEMTIVLETYATSMSGSLIAGWHEVSVNMLFSRRPLYSEKADANDEVVPVSWYTALQKVPRTIPTERSRLNGLADAFVKTVKRDCVVINARPEANGMLHQRDTGFEHCTGQPPHKYPAPRQFRRANLRATHRPVLCAHLQYHA